MPVESGVFEFELLLMAVLVYECCLELPLAPRMETLNLYLIGEIHVVQGQSLEDGLLGAPVDGELLVAPVVIEVVYLVL